MERSQLDAAFSEIKRHNKFDLSATFRGSLLRSRAFNDGSSTLWKSCDQMRGHLLTEASMLPVVRDVRDARRGSIFLSVGLLDRQLSRSSVIVRAKEPNIAVSQQLLARAVRVQPEQRQQGSSRRPGNVLHEVRREDALDISHCTWRPLRARGRLARLMGSDAARINDWEYMRSVKRRMQDEYSRRLERELCQLRNSEVDRLRRLRITEPGEAEPCPPKPLRKKRRRVCKTKRSHESACGSSGDGSVVPSQRKSVRFSTDAGVPLAEIREESEESGHSAETCPVQATTRKDSFPRWIADALRRWQNRARWKTRKSELRQLCHLRGMRMPRLSLQDELCPPPSSRVAESTATTQQRPSTACSHRDKSTHTLYEWAERLLSRHGQGDCERPLSGDRPCQRGRRLLASSTG